MKHIQQLRDSQRVENNPGQGLGDFLLQHSNNPEYLVSQLSAYLEAAQADLEAQRELGHRLMVGLKKEGANSLEKYNVVIANNGIAVAVSRSPLSHGVPIGESAYQVLAEGREQAKELAKERWRNREPSDDACHSNS